MCLSIYSVCAVAQQAEVGFLSDQKRDSIDESKSGGADNLTSMSCEELRKSCHKDGLTLVDAVQFKEVTAHEQAPAIDMGIYQAMECDRNDGYGHHSSECNASNVKPQSEKLGWRNVGRYLCNYLAYKDGSSLLPIPCLG